MIVNLSPIGMNTFNSETILMEQGYAYRGKRC